MQFDRLKRREFITLIGSAAAWPLAVSAQQTATPVIGFIDPLSLETTREKLAAFIRGLAELGYIEGRNVAIEYRWAEGQTDRLPALAADLVHRQVAVIATPGATAATLAAKAATEAIPIVFVVGGDPVKLGLVASLNRPGGNVTGVSFLAGAVGTKRLELPRELVPDAITIAVLLNRNTPEAEEERRELQAAAQATGQQLIVADAGNDHDIEGAFAMFARAGAGGLFVGSGAFLNSRRQRVAALAIHDTIPAIFSLREFAEAGGLMSYGTSLTGAYRQASDFVVRILEGANPADLPVLQVTKFEFVINVKTAKALGVKISDNLLSLVDEVIE
jgi:putative tryptophan/tyrosine transport system substrate-binding protein